MIMGEKRRIEQTKLLRLGEWDKKRGVGLKMIDSLHTVRLSSHISCFFFLKIFNFLPENQNYFLPFIIIE